MMKVPTGERELITFTNELIEQCNVSVGMRTSYCRLINAITETGRVDGGKSLINLLFKHLDRTAAHLFSPVELKFSVDFERPYPKGITDKAAATGKLLTRDWERNNTDVAFGRGVFESLKYGACILKQWPQVEGIDETPKYYKKLIMPWQMGVYNEAENELNRQSAICETTRMTMPDIWRRIWHLPDAKKIFNRVKANSSKGNTIAEPQSFFHQILSTSTLDTGVNGGTRTAPGGIIQLNSNPNFEVLGPQIAADTVEVHELWVQDQDLNDYTTIIMVAPDIIIAPLYKKMNLLGVAKQQPYRLIQPNEVTNWIWGRSELIDIIEPQQLLSIWADDIKRLFGLQIDKIMAFSGEDGITDERYGQFREAGYVNLAPNSKVQDLTPQMPPNSMEMLKFVIDIINNLAGFPDIMRGQGEAGVRAGTHASTLMKTASPTLRDRALLVERQCAVAADLTLAIKTAKDPSKYWTNGDTIQAMEETSFLLTDLPKDRRVAVDSHSSSPIFSDEAAQLVFQSHRSGIVTSEYVIETLSYPNKEVALAQLKEKELAAAKQQQELMARLPPEEAAKVVTKKLTGSKAA